MVHTHRVNVHLWKERVWEEGSCTAAQAEPFEEERETFVALKEREAEAELEMVRRGCLSVSWISVEGAKETDVRVRVPSVTLKRVALKLGGEGSLEDGERRNEIR